MRQAMIFAAGLGTRLRPLTDTMPKALVPVAGKPLLWHVVMKLKQEGFERIVVNVHHFAQQIIDYLQANDNFGLDIRISDEREQLLDTGGGIRKALPLFDEESPILIHNVDILSNARLRELYDRAAQSQYAATLLVSERITSRYLVFNRWNVLRAWINKDTREIRTPMPFISSEGKQELAFSGIHVIKPTVFPLLQKMPQRFPIIDFYINHSIQLDIYGATQWDLKLLDVGKVDTLQAAETFISQQLVNSSTH